MGTSLRVLATTAAVLLASGALQAESGIWGGQIGMAQPSGGAKQWVDSTVGVALDVTDTYSLGGQDSVRMRFGYFTFKASSSAPQTLTVPGWAQATYPANTDNEAYAFTYGAEYVRTLPARLYVLAGLGVAYATANRTGTFDLTNAGAGPVKSNYDANNFVPYYCAGLGFQITRSLALEARYQTTSMKAQTRKLDLKGLGIATPAQVAFDKLTVSTLTFGVSLTF
ncbi:outer membrane beta-barrel protein [Mesoterricola silvestris]|nr:outer membrane beta-barrel protein [Mesoterricola silvestris]